MKRAGYDTPLFRFFHYPYLIIMSVCVVAEEGFEPPTLRI